MWLQLSEEALAANATELSIVYKNLCSFKFRRELREEMNNLIAWSVVRHMVRKICLHQRLTCGLDRATQYFALKKCWELISEQ